MARMTRLYRPVTALLLAALVAACGTDSSSSGSGNGASDSGFTLRLTDAAFDEAARVELTFVEVQLRNSAGSWITIPFDQLSASTIDVAQLQGTRSEELVGGIDVPAGDYTEMRLLVDESQSKFFDTLGAEFELRVPSGRLVVKGDFTVSETMPTLMIVDVDLRRSIMRTGPFYNMQNPVLRLVDGKNFGHARGMLDALLLTAPTCSDALADTFNSVYVFEGHGVTPDDIDNQDAEPVTTSKITYDPASSGFKYEAGFLPAGEYTISFTCNSDVDELNTSEDLQFFGTQDITIKVNDTVFL